MATCLSEDPIGHAREPGMIYEKGKEWKPTFFLAPRGQSPCLDYGFSVTLVTVGMVTSPREVRCWTPRRSARAKAYLGLGIGSQENARMGPARLALIFFNKNRYPKNSSYDMPWTSR